VGGILTGNKILMDGNENTLTSPPRQDFGGFSLSRPPKNPSRFFFIILFVVVIGILLFVVNALVLPKGGEKKPSNLTPSPTPVLSDEWETFSPTDTLEPTRAATPSPTTKPTTSPVDSATGLDRSELAIVIYNGSGVVGSASKASDFLKGLGYRVTSVGNADAFDYQDVVVQIKSEKKQYLALLQKDIEKEYAVGSSSAQLSASESADAIVIIGK